MAYGFVQSGIVEIDIHGMTKQQAKRAVEQKLRSAGRSVYRVRVIHGFHGGTELRDMVRGELAKNPKVIRMELGLNQGQTDLVLRELF